MKKYTRIQNVFRKANLFLINHMTREFRLINFQYNSIQLDSQLGHGDIT